MAKVNIIFLAVKLYEDITIFIGKLRLKRHLGFTHDRDGDVSPANGDEYGLSVHVHVGVNDVRIRNPQSDRGHDAYHHVHVDARVLSPDVYGDVHVCREKPELMKQQV